MIIASALMLVGCVEEMGTDSFDNIKLEKTMLLIPENGGTVELKLTATEKWEFDTLYTEDVWPTVITREKTELFFQTFQCAADRRLCHLKILCSSCNAPVIGNLDKDLQIACIHTSPPVLYLLYIIKNSDPANCCDIL